MVSSTNEFIDVCRVRSDRSETVARRVRQQNVGEKEFGGAAESVLRDDIPGEGLPTHRISDGPPREQRGKIALEESGIYSRRVIDSLPPDPCALVARKEKSLALENRSTHGVAELISNKFWFGRRECVPCIELVVPMELPQAAMEGIGP